MTDNEIIKALECCSKNPLNCRECGYKGRCNRIDCYDYLKRDAFDLINRQQAEIERFKKIETTVNGFWEGIQKLAMFKDKEIPTLEELLEYMDNLKTEAIKEFAERLKERQQTFTGDEYVYKFIYLIEIDNLVKEMVGDTE